MRKTARFAVLLAVLSAVAGCTARQRDEALATVGSSLLSSLLDAQRSAQLTQSTSRPAPGTDAELAPAKPERTVVARCIVRLRHLDAKRLTVIRQVARSESRVATSRCRIRVQRDGEVRTVIIIDDATL
jgi:hypothetical protein